MSLNVLSTIFSSLAWCFSYYHATLKRGALDKDLAALFYRAVLFLSVLFQILGRIFIFVLFSYSFGKGMYYPLLIFLGSHILLMSILHFVFSDAKKVRIIRSWLLGREGEYSNSLLIKCYILTLVLAERRLSQLEFFPLHCWQRTCQYLYPQLDTNGSAAHSIYQAPSTRIYIMPTIDV